MCISGNIDAFVMSAGTGGTIAGVSQYLKQQQKRHKQKEEAEMSGGHAGHKESIVVGATDDTGSINYESCIKTKSLASQKPCKPIKVYLADPPGSSLYNKVKHGVCYASQQAEKVVRKHRYDTIAEGIGEWC